MNVSDHRARVRMALARWVTRGYDLAVTRLSCCGCACGPVVVIGVAVILAGGYGATTLVLA